MELIRRVLIVNYKPNQYELMRMEAKEVLLVIIIIMK